MANITESDLRAMLRIGHDASMRGSGRSLRDLLASKRYLELRPWIDEGAMVQAIHNEPELVDQWIAYSEDKRTSGGWWLLGNRANWEVGRFGDLGKPAIRDAFDSAEIATAVYVLRELDFWAGVDAGGKP